MLQSNLFSIHSVGKKIIFGKMLLRLVQEGRQDILQELQQLAPSHWP